MTGPSDFRWPALFQQSGDALFVLNRHRRLLFANRAWEALAGLPLAEARGLACRLSRPAAPSDSLPDVLAHALWPPPEVLDGQSARARRLLPSRGGARWWDVEFFPLFQDKSLLAVLGRVLPVAAPEPAAPTPPLPEKLVALRERAARDWQEGAPDDAAPAMRRLAAAVRLAATVTAPVLLTGEPGAGKRTLARMIHFRSPGRERSFAALDATRLPPAALAAVLFGDRNSERSAGVGTVYVKEPGLLPHEFQLQLTELINSADLDRPAPRILAGCSGDAAASARAGQLANELYAALAPFTIAVPPLRDRADELPGLMQRMLARVNEDGERVVSGLAPDAWEVVRAYSWPGNLRELFAVLASARSQAKADLITAADLPAPLRLSLRLGQTPAPPPEKPLPLESLLEEVERRLIRLALKRTGGNRGRAAAMLGVWRQRLVRRMEALGLADNGEPRTE
jgi:hypothetical protein